MFLSLSIKVSWHVQSLLYLCNVFKLMEGKCFKEWIYILNHAWVMDGKLRECWLAQPCQGVECRVPFSKVGAWQTVHIFNAIKKVEMHIYRLRWNGILKGKQLTISMWRIIKIHTSGGWASLLRPFERIHWWFPMAAARPISLRCKIKDITYEVTLPSSHFMTENINKLHLVKVIPFSY